MNYIYHGLTHKSRLVLTDFNCASSVQRLREGNCYKLIWARERDVHLGMDGYQVIVKKDHVFFCTPLNDLETACSMSGAISLIFSKEFYCLQDYVKNLSFSKFPFKETNNLPLVELSEGDRQNFDFLFRLFKKEFERTEHFQGEMLMVLLRKLLIMFKRIIAKLGQTKKISNNPSSVIEEFNVLLESHFRDKHKVNDYAAMLHRSPKSISSIIKKSTKKTALSLINERILIEARRLLLLSDKTSEEISYHLGYRDPSHFSKFFKKNVGTSPTHFRKNSLAQAY